MKSIKLDFSHDIFMYGDDVSGNKLYFKMFNVLASRITILPHVTGNYKVDDIKFISLFDQQNPGLSWQVINTATHDKEEVKVLYEENPETIPLEIDDFYAFLAVDETNRIIYKYTDSKLHIFYDTTQYRMIQGVVSKMQELYKECISSANSKAKVHVITFDGQDFSLMSCKINGGMPVDLKKHYNDDFESVSNRIESFIDSVDSGLVILYGKAGTGKTNYLRHLMINHNKKFIILNNALMNSIADPAFMKFVLEQKDSVLILEDCEQLLQDRKNNPFNNGISNILNMTDGLYSDILNIKIFATFNADIKDIDQALLRKGRLVSKYEFCPLSANKTNQLMKELGKPENHPEEMVLADIYNFEDVTGGENMSKRKIGF